MLEVLLPLRFCMKYLGILSSFFREVTDPRRWLHLEPKWKQSQVEGELMGPLNFFFPLRQLNCSLWKITVCSEWWLKEIKPIAFFQLSGFWRHLWITHSIKYCNVSDDAFVHMIWVMNRIGFQVAATKKIRKHGACVLNEYVKGMKSVKM